MATEWCPLAIGDMEWVNRIADSVHMSLPERPEVFEEKIRLFPEGCRKLIHLGTIVGYGISHPWMLASIPPLDTFLKQLPAEPQCMYIHDVAVLPAVRGHGAAGHYVEYVKGLARQMGISALALVSVYGTDRLWSRFGFKVLQNASLDIKLQSYGTTAKYMVYDDND